MVLVVTFWVENNVFIEWLWIVTQEDETTQDILKEVSLGDIKKFTKKNKFLLFQERIYVPTKLRKEVIAEQHELLIHKY